MEGREGMTLSVLGPVRASAGHRRLELGGPKQRLLLALLVVDLRRVVSTGALIDGLWTDDPPDTARKTMQGYVHHLRDALGRAIQTEQSGYRLQLPDEAVDARGFELAYSQGRRLLERDPEAASAVLFDALGMWNGQPYADLHGSVALEPEITRLAELRLDAVECRVEADLNLGATGELIGELESLTREYPLRERLRALHMRALYAGGRQAEALRSFERTRRFLGEELGIDPSPELRRLEEMILSHDPALDLPPFRAVEPRLRALRGYELRESVGGGAIGTVYRAYQTSMNREVALKVIHADLADDPQFIELFEEEARRVGTLEHPHIVPLHDSWREPGAAYQVRPWMAGGDLRDRLGAEKVPLGGALQLLDEVAEALAYAHRQGIDHCRVKPSNILFDADGNAYLSDFAIHGTGALTLTTDDHLYLSPEVRRGEAPHIPGSDVYSLGVLAHELLVGVPPRVASDGSATVAGDLGEVFAAEIGRALDPEPALRHGRMEALVRGIRQATGTDVSPSAATPVDLPRSELRNPYKGLRAFQETDAADFFGRDDLVDRILTGIDPGGFVAVVGPSGIGKSSVVKAGVIPALRARRQPEDPPLLVTDMFPGSHPFEELEAALLRVAIDRPTGMIEDLMSDDRGLLRVSKQILPDDAGRIVLVIDQFEELFSLVADDGVRTRFLASLATALADDRSRIRVIATLRADFYDRPLEFSFFGGLLERHTVPVMAPSADDLARAIAGPARAVGLDLEPGLVGEIVHDVTDQPGGLPLLQYALTELFEQRRSDTLTTAGYRATGGVLGALGRRAEELFQGLSDAGQEAIRQTFLRLITVDEAADDMRRRVRRSELAGLDVPQHELQGAITAFGAHRLLSFDRDPLTRGPTIEVAHEALIREWDRLRRWIETQREDLILHRRLAAALSEWESADREPGYLLRGGRLAHFEAWAAGTSISLTGRELEFLDASRALRDAEAAREARTNRRLRTMLIGVSGLLVVAAVAGMFASAQARRAEDEAAAALASREQAETRRLVFEAPQLFETNRQVALLLAVEAFQRDPGPVTLGALQQVLARAENFLGYIGVGTRPTDVAFNAAGELVTIDRDAIRVVDIDSGAARLELPSDGADLVVTSPSNDRAALAGPSGVHVVDLANGATVHELTVQPATAVTAMAFDTTGTRLAIGEAGGALTVHDLDTGTALTIEDAHWERTAEGAEGPAHQPGLAQFGVRAIAFSPDGSRLATGGLVMARVWDLETGAKEAEVWHERPDVEGNPTPAAVSALAFHDEGRRLWVASTFNVVDYAIAPAGLIAASERLFPDRIGAVGATAIDALVQVKDGYAVMAQIGGRIVVLSLDDRRAPLELDAQVSGFPVLASAPQLDRLAVAGDQGTSIWSISGDSLITRTLPRHQHTEVTFTRDGSWAVLSTPAATPIDLYDLTNDAVRPIEVPPAPASHFGWLGLPDGLVTLDFDTQLVRFRAFDDVAGVGVTLGSGPMMSWAGSADGRFIAVGGGPPTGEATVWVYDFVEGRIVAPVLDHFATDDPESSRIVFSLSFNPDATRLVGASSDGAAVVWNTSTWEVEQEISQGGGQVVVTEYSPDGRWLVTMSQSGRILLRDPDTLQAATGPLSGQTDSLAGFTHGPVFTPDGRYMVTTADGVGRLWDLDAGRLIGGAFPNDAGTSAGASADARWLGTFRDDVVMIWDLDVSRWAGVACRAAGRNLTADEWAQFGPDDTSYSTTCSMWPPAAAGDAGEEEP